MATMKSPKQHSLEQETIRLARAGKSKKEQFTIEKRLSLLEGWISELSDLLLKASLTAR